MSTQPQQPPAGGVVIPAAPVPLPRDALGWPAGSVRAFLALSIVGLICALILMATPDNPLPIPAFLFYLLFLILGHYFAARGHETRDEDRPGPPPLYLPRGTVRFLLLGALVATVVWKAVNDRPTLELQMRESAKGLQQHPLLPLVVLGGFLLGVCVRSIITRNRRSIWAQDVQAWFSLMSVIVMAVGVILHLVIKPSLTEGMDLETWEGILGGVIAFYFGERS